MLRHEVWRYLLEVGDLAIAVLVDFVSRRSTQVLLERRKYLLHYRHPSNDHSSSCDQVCVSASACCVRSVNVALLDQIVSAHNTNPR